MSDDIKGLHDRFDNLERNFDGVRKEQHDMAKSLVDVSHRIDVMEIQVDAAQKRETMVVESINEKLTTNTNLIEKLFIKFDNHTESENADRKKLLFWLAAMVVSTLGTVAWVIIGKVFGI